MNRIRSLLNRAGVNIITPIYQQPSLSNYTFTYVGNEGNIADNLTRQNIDESPVSTQRGHFLTAVLTARLIRRRAPYFRWRNPWRS